ncbi:MAG: hypothetical protein K0V04_19970 [Deltaproteobacteria bacterium]|nr:hypothetical protein [Deltaproteobacteria bacterium]
MDRSFFALSLLLVACDPQQTDDWADDLQPRIEEPEECPDPTLGSYAVRRNGQLQSGWMFTFNEDGTWRLDLGATRQLTGTWEQDPDDACLIHYTNPLDNGGQGSEADFRWDGNSWNKEGGSTPGVTIELESFM